MLRKIDVYNDREDLDTLVSAFVKNPDRIRQWLVIEDMKIKSDNHNFMKLHIKDVNGYTMIIEFSKKHLEMIAQHTIGLLEEHIPLDVLFR